jgi:methylglyoxal synthase
MELKWGELEAMEAVCHDSASLVFLLADLSCKTHDADLDRLIQWLQLQDMPFSATLQFRTP